MTSVLGLELDSLSIGNSSYSLAERNIWMGYGGTVSGLHYYSFHNLHYLVEGSKDFLLFEPESRKVIEKSMVEVKTSTGQSQM